MKAQVTRRPGIPARLDVLSGAADRRARRTPACPTIRSTCRRSKLKEVTAAQVQEVARKYLVDDNLTVAVLDPQPVGERKPAPPVPPEHRH